MTLPSRYKPSGEFVKITEVTDRQGILELRVEGSLTESTIQDLLRSLAELLAERKPTRILLDGRTITGAPSTLDRYTLGSGLARILPNAVRAAMVVRKEMIDPGKLGVVVARNRGLAANSFDDREAAIRWLTEGSEGPAPT
ncbi:MAG TPA: STAS/SEC14 domain-containing protein [Planctomycetota bacterium]|nr:STAS/SEC14 domain-containing protein [Planctomycetota bacterium]